MNKQIKITDRSWHICLAGIFWVSVCLQESLFHTFVSDYTISGGVLGIAFAVALALAASGTTALLPPRGAKVWVVLAQAVIAFFYASQLIYQHIFGTFYSLYSLLNGAQALQFFKQIGGAVAACWWQIGLLLLPLLWTCAFLKLSPPPDRRTRTGIAMLFSMLLAHAIALSIVPAFGFGGLTPHRYYYNALSIGPTASTLGMMNAFRLDAERTLFGFPLSEQKLTLEFEATEPPKQAPEEKYTPNSLPIDFNALLAAETQAEVRELHQVFAARQPTLQNEMTGKYEGYNLIFLTAEGYSPYAIDEKLTPTLYKMANQGYRFTNFYNPIWGVSTTDGEYVNCLGLLPKVGVWSMYQSRENALPFALGNQFREQGYQTYAYHNHDYAYYRRDLTHPHLGYAYKGVGNGLQVTQQWPESDVEMMQASVPEYIGNTPFHVYYMTVSGHMEYNWGGNAQSAKHRSEVEGLPYSEPCKAYIACQMELDRALENLLAQLEKAGIAEKTVIALAPDHYPYGLSNDQISELAGAQVDDFSLYKSSFLLYVPGMEPQTVDKLCWSADIMPTLSNLFGLPYDSRLMTGKDIFSTADPLVIFQDHSFLTNRVGYNAVIDQAQWLDGQAADEAYLQSMKQAVEAEFTIDTRILNTNYYAKVLP